MVLSPSSAIGPLLRKEDSENRGDLFLDARSLMGDPRPAPPSVSEGSPGLSGAARRRVPFICSAYRPKGRSLSRPASLLHILFTEVLNRY